RRAGRRGRAWPCAGGVRRRPAPGADRTGRMARGLPGLAARGRGHAGAAAADRRAARGCGRAPGDRSRGHAGTMSGARGSAWPAPAKLNLFLQVTGRRADGYHELQTVFRILDWGDTVHLRPRGDGRILRYGSDLAAVPEEVDLSLRAARLLQKEFNVAHGADIRVEKRTRAGGGFGGG